MNASSALWLFGENLGTTMNNNSWYTFQHLVLHRTDVPSRAYFAVRDTAAARERLQEVPDRLRRRIVWHGSKKHLRLFHRADRFFLTLSFGDIEPDEVAGSSTRLVPITHLQHGTTGLKKVGYRGDYYRGMLDTFCIYSREEQELLVQHNGFRPEQLYRASAQPRYAELLRRQSERPTRPGKILWFLTWRDYLRQQQLREKPGREETQPTVSSDGFIQRIIDTLLDPSMLDLIPDEFSRITVALHQYVDRALVNELRNRFGTLIFEADHPAKHLRGRVQFVHASEVDVMDLMVEAELLVSDYSSLPFDFTYLEKPVVLYRFDVDEYLAHRDTYIDLREVFTDLVAYEPAELAATIRAGRGKAHPFYRSRIDPPRDAIERERIAAGSAIDDLIDHHIRRDVKRTRRLDGPVGARKPVVQRSEIR